MVKDTSIDFKSFPIGIVVKYFALLHFPEKNYEYFLPEKNWFLLFLTVGSLSVNLSLLKTVHEPYFSPVNPIYEVQSIAGQSAWSANCFTHGGGKDANFTLLEHTPPPPVLKLYANIS